jgi:hypothetical protein
VVCSVRRQAHGGLAYLRLGRVPDPLRISSGPTTQVLEVGRHAWRPVSGAVVTSAAVVGNTAKSKRGRFPDRNLSLAMDLHWQWG